MIAIALLMVVAACGFGVLVSKWRNGSASIVLAALPIALLFPVLPIAPAIWSMIRGFQNMSQSGESGIVQAGALCVDVSRSLFWGSIGFVFVVAAAAALQVRAGDEEPEQSTGLLDAAADSPTPGRSIGVVEVIFLVASSLLVLPAVGLIHLTAGIPRLVMSTASLLTGKATAAASTVPLGETSELISSRLVSSMLAGGLLSVLLVIAGVGCLIALRSPRPPRWLTMYSWLAAAACTLLAILNAIQLQVDIRSFELAMR